MRFGLAAIIAAGIVSASGSAMAQSFTPEEVDAIGRAMVEAAGTGDAKIVLLGRFDDDFAAMTLRYKMDGSNEVVGAFLESPPDVYEIWKRERTKLGDDVWWQLVYVLDHGTANLRLWYANEVDWDSGYSDWATAVEQETFGTAEP